MIEYIWQDLIFPLLLNLIQQQPRQLNNKFFSGEMSCKMPPAAWCRKYTLILLIAVPVPHWGGSKDPHREFQAIPSGLGWVILHYEPRRSEGWGEGERWVDWPCWEHQASKISATPGPHRAPDVPVSSWERARLSLLLNKAQAGVGAA